jgi:hypothetical protein
MQRSLLDQLIELTKSDYPDDWVRFCHLARVIEGESVSLDEAARSRLRVHGRYDLAAFSPRLAHEVSESRALCKKFVEHFADIFRNQMVGRTKGSRETKPLEPALIRPKALRFDPDELVLDKGELIIVDVRIEPAPAPLPNAAAAPVHRLSGKECIRDVFEPRRDELSAMTITDAAKVLAEASNLKVGSCANLLRATGAWKKQPRGQLNPPRPRSK